MDIAGGGKWVVEPCGAIHEARERVGESTGTTTKGWEGTGGRTDGRTDGAP